MYEILTEITPPVTLTAVISRSLTKNIRVNLKSGIMIAPMHINMHIQSPQIAPLTSPPEFFLKADIKPPRKEEKYKETLAKTGINFSLMLVYVIITEKTQRRIKQIIILNTDEIKLLLYV